MTMPTPDELIQLRLDGEQQQAEQLENYADERMLAFVERLEEVMRKLDMRLRTAARLGYLELKLISVNSPRLIDLEKVVRLDPSRRSTWGGGNAWITVNPYQDKSVVRHPGLIALWDRLESYGLRPIFIEGASGAPVFGVQLPSGGPYPRDDMAAEVAWRTANRLDQYLEEDGRISFTPASLSTFKPRPEGE
jgi:hypothetical protein